MSSLASSSWRYLVFTSFYGSDVRTTFLTRLREQFSQNGIIMYNDEEEIERGQTIAPGLFEAIRRSRISIVVFSKNYARSRWCLDELVEILKCKEEIGNIVIPVYYGVNPSDVQNLTGDFGIAFSETCVGSTEEKRRRWSQALLDMGDIPGLHALNREESESTLIEKISLNVLNNVTTLSWGLEDDVGNEPHLEQTQPPPLHDGEAQLEQTQPLLREEGLLESTQSLLPVITDEEAQPEQLLEEILEAHLEKVQSLLHFDDEERIMVVGIYGHLGIGKTTIVKALHNRLSTRFQFTGFVENRRGSYPFGLDGNDLKLHFQNQLRSRNLNQNGTIEELRHLKALIILDDVDDIRQLDAALANETTWLGPGSRIVVTTESSELLQQHGINSTYHVDFPSREEALKILCSYAFRQSSPPNDFKELAESVVDLCGNLPSRLRKEGLALFGKTEDTWKAEKYKLQRENRRAVEYALRHLGYEPPLFNMRIGRRKTWCSIAMDILVVLNLLCEITSVAADQLSTIQKPNFARVSLGMSFLSLLISILDICYKYYYPLRNDNRIFGSFTDTVLCFCVIGQCGVSTTNWYFIERQHEGPVNVSLWPLFFAIGMVCSKFIGRTRTRRILLPR